MLVIGSKNSSNSQRLAETARFLNKPAYLIDDQNGVDPAWLDGVETVLVTAGASAPEHLVDGLLERLKQDFDAEIELRSIATEDITFEPPKSLKKLVVVG